MWIASSRAFLGSVLSLRASFTAVMQPSFGGRNKIPNIWGSRTPFHGSGKWPEGVDYRISEEPDR